MSYELVEDKIKPRPAVEGKARTFLFGSRQLDFWLLGGLSIVAWAPFYFLQEQLAEYKTLTYNVSWIAFYLAYFVNFPHFMASYKLAYTQGRGFVLNNWFQLLAVPIVLVMAIAASGLFWGADHGDSQLVLAVNQMLTSLGLNTRIGLYPNLGSEVLGLLVNLMFFTVGWHYAKQAFGSMMVYAKLDGYSLTNLQRNVIRYSLLSTWWVTWLNINCFNGTYPYYGLKIHRLDFPYLWLQISYGVLGMLFAALIVMLIVKYRREGQLPSVNFLVPMLALLVWHVPILSNPQFFYFLAFFHSLQYLPFVAKVEKSRYQKQKNPYPQRRLGLFFVVMLILGYLSFDLIPNQLDQVVQAYSVFGASFFLIAFLVFINIHHYFIDNVLWRFKNREVKTLLLD